MDEDDVSAAVRTFIASELGAKRDKVLPGTTLQHDLGIDGDDADDFLAAFARRFNVDLSGLDFNQHFEGEGFDPFGCALVLYWLFPRWIPSPYPLRKIPITVNDLIAVVRAGRWLFPYPSDT